ncbi:MAG: hypothetical protein J5I93_19915 [Pirellulaceae bacterium]|nr:hypothetical protein [Pirellulaceae bacterium]
MRKSWLHARTNRNRTPKRNPRRCLRFETLDSRQLLAANVLALPAAPVANAQEAAAFDQYAGHWQDSQPSYLDPADVARGAWVGIGQGEGDGESGGQQVPPLTEEEIRCLEKAATQDNDRHAAQLLQRHQQAQEQLDAARQELAQKQEQAANDPLSQQLQSQIEQAQKALDELDKQIEDLNNRVKSLENDVQQPTPHRQVIRIGGRPGHYVIIEEGQPQVTVDLRKELQELPKQRARAAKTLEKLENSLERRQEQLQREIDKCQQKVDQAEKKLDDATAAARAYAQQLKERENEDNDPPAPPPQPEQPTEVRDFEPVWFSADGDIFGQLVGHVAGEVQQSSRDPLERFLLDEAQEGHWTQVTTYLADLLGKPVQILSQGLSWQDVVEFLFNFALFVQKRGEQLGEGFNGHLEHKATKEIKGHAFGLGDQSLGTLMVCIKMKDGQFEMTVDFRATKEQTLTKRDGTEIRFRDFTKTYKGKIVAPK